MERGFIFDRGYGGATAADWAEGEPVVGFFGAIKPGSARRREIVAYRCSACGLLQQFAH
jgi:hypothetical protein